MAGAKLVDRRWEELREVEAKFWDHVCRPGNWFPANTRLRIALSAESACDCLACSKKWKDSDKELDFCTEDCIGNDDYLADEPLQFLIPIVHEIANFQGRIDQTWVSGALLAITSHLASHADGDIAGLEHVDVCGAYCEVVGVPAQPARAATGRARWARCRAGPRRLRRLLD